VRRLFHKEGGDGKHDTDGLVGTNGGGKGGYGHARSTVVNGADANGAGGRKGRVGGGSGGGGGAGTTGLLIKQGAALTNANSANEVKNRDPHYQGGVGTLPLSLFAAAVPLVFARCCCGMAGAPWRRARARRHLSVARRSALPPTM